jgi:hypothetical protein
MSSSTILAGRALGKYPLSIATSLALESAANIHDELKHDRTPILDYQEFWVNLRTLFRNLVGACEAEDTQLMPGPCAEALDQEMAQIESIVAELTSGRCKVRFYLCTFADLDRRYPQATTRYDTTVRQKEYTMLLKETLKLLVDHDKKTQAKRILGFDVKLKPEAKCKALILTHYPIDLCSEKAFHELVLVESHTGHIKEKAQWYTKYLNGKDLFMMPFREDLLQVLGDKETFRPYPIKQREELLEIAKQYRWTAATTLDKIRYGIDQLKNPFFKAKLRAMLVP